MKIKRGCIPSLGTWSAIPKKGGLGIHKAHEWVIVCTIKNLWNVIIKEDTLWVRWIRNRYLDKNTIWSFLHYVTCSWLWCKLSSHIFLFKNNVDYRLGDETTFRFWHNPWVKGKFLTDILDERMVLYLVKGNDCTIQEAMKDINPIARLQ